MISALAVSARYGRSLLVAGLLAGIFLPAAAAFIRDYIPELVALLLFLAAFRVGPRQAVGAMADLRHALGSVLLLQLLIPMLLAAGFAVIGWPTPLLLGVALMAAAPAISGSPNLAIMTGNDPAPSLRLLVIGTALLPLTAIPVFWMLPGINSAAQVIPAASRLLVLILAAALLAFLLRWRLLPHLDGQNRDAVDGASAWVMAIVVVGLMVAVGPALATRPAAVAVALGVVFVANFGLQLLVRRLSRGRVPNPQSVALGIAAGNRNIALFLTALPAGFTDQLMLFIGCYQIPMYLTPIAMGWLYKSEEEKE